jgi:hypothetical protein
MTTNYAKVRVGAIIFEPLGEAEAPPDNALYANVVNGGIVSIGASVPVSTSENSIFSKNMVAGVAGIPINTPVAKQSDGRIVPLDRDNPVAIKPIGVTTTAGINENVLVGVFLSGPNLPGVLTGKGFTPGAIIYSDNVAGGMVDDISSFNPQTDAILRLGIADCASGIAAAEATDLILSIEIISYPSGV